MITMKDIDEVEYYFKLAYVTKKTVKTIHNYAWYLFYEMDNYKEAYRIQKECIALNPKTPYSFLLYCEALLELKKYKQALKILLKLQKTFDSRVVVHNLWYCYFKLWDYDTAIRYFLSASSNWDEESKSLFALVISYYKIGEKEKVYDILYKILNSELFEKSFFTYELACIYFEYEDYQKVKEVTLKAWIGHIDLLDRLEIWYSIYSVDEDLLWKEMKANIQKLEWHIKEEETREANSKTEKKEKKDSIKYYKKEIQKKQNFDTLFLKKPKSNVERFLIFEYSNCTLFDCKRHNNPPNDY